jgi:cleavage and polyadenylation specificity factor subunit 1
MAAEDIEKTAIITPFGLFEYLFMPFGLTNAAQSFQRLMDKLFRHLPFVFTYLDDHLIASRTLEEHLLHLQQFFQVLQENGLTINPAKCVFAVSSLKFLGHMVDEAGITPLPRHVAAVQDCPPPTDIKQLQRFLGLINFYRRFLPAVARTLKPLTDLLKGSPKVLLWSPAADAAFVAAKAALVAAVPLCHPAPQAVLSLAVDASDSHVGGVLQQKCGRGWQPLAFYSKKLSSTETKYSTFDRELLAAFLTIRHFRFLLEGRQFTLLTDHKPLIAAMTRVTPPQSARQQRHLAFVSEFTTDLRHTPGSENVVADALSRPPPVLGTPAAGLPVLSIPPASLTSEPPRQTAPPTPVADAQPIDFLELSFAQPACPDVQAMLVSDSLSVVSKKFGAADILGDVSTGVFRPLLPARFRSAAVWSLHNIHHPGVRASRRLVCSSFCWPKMGVFVSALVRNCLHCQKAKVHRHVSLQAAHIPVPVRRFSHLHVDLVGPLPRSSGFSYLFTMVDRTTRWPEAVPLSSTTAADCAAALLQGWIQRFGVPDIITSDTGPQFTSSLWASLCSLLSISHTQTTAYHPQSNGLVERFHRRLKDALRARAAGVDWFLHLPWVLLGIRSAWREGAEFSPSEAVFGSQLVLPGQFLSTPESPSPSFLRDFQGVLAGRPPLPTSHHTTPAPTSLPEDLLLSRFVLVRHDGVQPPLSPLYDGPFLVVERSLHFFKLQMGAKVETVSTHRLKPCHAPQDAQAAEPPRRGRPPNAAKPPVVCQPQLSDSRQQSCFSDKVSPSTPKQRRRVTFSRPLVTSGLPPPLRPPPAPPDIKLGRPVRSTARPVRYTA